MEPHAHEEEESEEEELKELENNILEPPHINEPTENSSSTETFVPTLPNQTHLSYHKTDRIYMDPAVVQYNKNSMYYLLVLFMMLIFVSLLKKCLL